MAVELAGNACQVVLQVLQHINQEFKNIGREDTAAADIAGRLLTIQPAIAAWVQQKSKIAAGVNVQITGHCKEHGRRARVIRFRDDWFRHNGVRQWDLQLCVSCTSCGSELLSGAKFCKSCGSRILRGPAGRAGSIVTLPEDSLSTLLSAGDLRLVEKLQCHVIDINTWLSTFREMLEKGEKKGFIKRWMHVCGNLKKKAIGTETTFQQLLKLVGELEKTLRDMQVVMQVSVATDVRNVVERQTQMMQMMQQLLEKMEQPIDKGMSAAEQQEVAKRMAEISGMHVRQVLEEYKDVLEEIKGSRIPPPPQPGPLPYGWVKATSKSGQVYYKHTESGHTQPEFPDWALINNPEARKFWLKFFSNSDSVPWDLFKRSMKEEFGFSDADLALIRGGCDIQGDGVVSKLEFNIFSVSHGIRGGLEILQERANAPKACGLCGIEKRPRHFSKYEQAKVDGLCKDCKGAARCSMAGCMRLTWNGRSREQCCRTCKDSHGAFHGPDCEKKHKRARVQLKGF